jgi:hypothetical protein
MRLSPIEHPSMGLLPPRLVTPTLVTRTPSVASSWLRARRRAAVRPDSSVRTARRTKYAPPSPPGLGPLAMLGRHAPRRLEEPPRRVRVDAPFTSPPGEPACARRAAGDHARARPSGRTASHDPPRRGARSASPRCLPSWAALLERGARSVNRARSIAPGGVDGFPQDVTSLWKSRRRLFNP